MRFAGPSDQRRRGSAFACAILGAALACDSAVAQNDPALNYWSGAYLGAHLGVGAAEPDGLFDSSALGFDPFQNVVRGEYARLDGAVVGAHVGFLTPYRDMLVGLELDWTALAWEDVLVDPDPGAPDTDSARFDLDWIAALRARIAKPSGQSLFTLSPGLAYLEGEFTANRRAFFAPASETLDISGYGFVVGAGFEHALAPALTMSVEAQYYGFDVEETVGVEGPTFDPGDFAGIEAIGLMRLGLTYRFNDNAAPPDVDPVDWRGLFVGVAGGYGRSFQDSLFDADQIGDPRDYDDSVLGELFTLDGAAGGVALGYNHVLTDGTILGFETDVAALGYSDRELDPELEPGATDAAAFDVDWLASARLRAGRVSGRSLFYATGGLAYVSAEYRAIEADLDSTPNGTGAIDLSGLGYVVGAGVEHALTDALRLTVDGRYYGFDRKEDASKATADSDPGDFAELSGVTLFQLGLRYRFDAP